MLGAQRKGASRTNAQRPFVRSRKSAGYAARCSRSVANDFACATASCASPNTPS